MMRATTTLPAPFARLATSTGGPTSANAGIAEATRLNTTNRLLITTLPAECLACDCTWGRCATAGRESARRSPRADTTTRCGRNELKDLRLLPWTALRNGPIPVLSAYTLDPSIDESVRAPHPIGRRKIAQI